jgi:SAM-dependent methyltransferase
MAALYDSIGQGYSNARRTDPRIAAQIHRALGSCRTVLNVGAGTGSYEPLDRRVVAVEPSERMVDQRAAAAAPCVRGVADALPFPDSTFDAALALLTVHHWPDPHAGLREVRRTVRGPIVVFTWDKQTHDGTWLMRDYLPAARALDTNHLTAHQIAEVLGGGTVEVVPVPWDCHDGFAHAYWRRPERYLDPAVRAGISCFARLDADVVDSAMARLADDLRSGLWRQRHRELLEQESVDCGYRLVIAPGAS